MINSYIKGIAHYVPEQVLTNEDLSKMMDTSDELKSLLSDLKNHPKRYINLSIFGKKEKPYLPEKINQ